MADVLRELTALLPLLALGLALAWAAAVLATVMMLVRPPRKALAWSLARDRPSTPDDLGLAGRWREWKLDAARSGVRGRASCRVWDIVGERSDGLCMVLTPGWSDSVLVGLERVPALLPHCRRVLLWDPPGLGESAGWTHLGFTEHALLRELVGRAGEDARAVVLMGWSMGAGISLSAASAERASGGRRFAGLVLESPYRLARTPALAVLGAHEFPTGPTLGPALALVRALAGWRPLVGASAEAAFDRAALARNVGCPVLVLHGSADRVSPLEDGARIASASGGTLVEITGARHRDLWSDAAHRAVCERAIAAFLSSIDAQGTDRVDGGDGRKAGAP